MCFSRIPSRPLLLSVLEAIIKSNSHLYVDFCIKCACAVFTRHSPLSWEAAVNINITTQVTLSFPSIVSESLSESRESINLTRDIRAVIIGAGPQWSGGSVTRAGGAAIVPPGTVSSVAGIVSHRRPPSCRPRPGVTVRVAPS